MNIAIIGSGLAATAAAKALIERGVKPVILDMGEVIDTKRAKTIHHLSSLNPNQWTDDEKQIISENATIYDKNSIPKKLAFGSNYFYGKSRKNAPIEYNGVIPPFSYAKGGYSVGWGASALPPDNCDLVNWPFGNEILQKYYQQAIATLPYSALDDGLSLNFPLNHSSPDPVSLTNGNRSILQALKSENLLEKDTLVFGQSRLFVQASDNFRNSGCKHCGYCMSGCVYGCIYKSNQDIDKMLASNSIEYINGVIVQTLSETANKVNITFVNDKTGKQSSLSFDRVLLAAGALNSTRIIMQSKQLYNMKVILKSTIGFVAPMIRLKNSPIEWPNTNTQPGIFLEYKAKNFSNHWIHTQLSTPNELVLARLGINFASNNLMQKIKKRLAGHLMIALCNMHSDHSYGYEIQLEKSTTTNTIDKLKSVYRQTDIAYHAEKKALKRLSKIGQKIKCYPLIPFVQSGIAVGGYHVGGSLPMRQKPEKETDTNLLGNPKGWHRVHVIDSSVFPSLPGTTIGLLAMANAMRIVAEMELN